MERSGSTVVRQSVKKLEGGNPYKIHDYASGDDPVVYTYRHPKEAYMSLRRCFEQIYPTSIARDYAQERICMQMPVFSAYKKDKEEKNRKVLFLKYEDYYFHERDRLVAISTWLGRNLDESVITQILQETSISTNVACSNGDTNFGEFDKETGLHGSHVNPITKGCPGMLLNSHTYSDDDFLGSQKMKDFCELFGYDPLSVEVR